MAFTTRFQKWKTSPVSLARSLPVISSSFSVTLCLASLNWASHASRVLFARRCRSSAISRVCDFSQLSYPCQLPFVASTSSPKLGRQILPFRPHNVAYRVLRLGWPYLSLLLPPNTLICRAKSALSTPPTCVASESDSHHHQHTHCLLWNSPSLARALSPSPFRCVCSSLWCSSTGLPYGSHTRCARPECSAVVQYST